MEEQKSKPTIEDVAKYCGVSVATVSRVINKSNPVSKELDAKVRKGIKELGFTPRQWTARTRSDTIAMAIPNILNPFYSEIIHGAQTEADRQDLNLVILNVAPDQKRQKQISQCSPLFEIEIGLTNNRVVPLTTRAFRLLTFAIIKKPPPPLPRI